MKFIITLLLFFSYFNKSNKVYTSDKEFNYEFYLSDIEQKKYCQKKTYYWFKSGKVQSTVASANGKLLDGFYKKTFKNQQLAEQGFFNKGLKNKVWKSWYESGKLKEVIHWNKGVKSGEYILFDTFGVKQVEGNYRKGLKHGEWIYHEKHDTISFNKSVIKQLKVKASRELKPKTDDEKLLLKIKTWFGKLFAPKSLKVTSSE